MTDSLLKMVWTRRVRDKVCLVITAIVLGAIILILSRLFVLFSESIAIVRADRASDEDFMEQCSAGGPALQSGLYRTACMEARAKHASPAVVKALSRVGSILYQELISLAMAPMRWTATVSLVGILGVLPWLPSVMRSLLWSVGVGGACTGRDADDKRHSVIIMHHGEPSDSFGSGGGGGGSHISPTKGSTRARRMITSVGTPPFIEEGYGDEDDGFGHAKRE